MKRKEQRVLVLLESCSLILRNRFLAVAARLQVDVMYLGVWCCIPWEEQYLLLVALSV